MVGITCDVRRSVSPSTWRATGTMFLLFGSTTTDVRRAPLDRLEDLRGRRVHRLAAGHDLVHAEAHEQPPDALADPDRDDRGLDLAAGRPSPARSRRTCRRAPASCSRTHCSSSTCSSRSVTRSWRGRPGFDAGFDRATDVVGVDVAVPEPVATDDDDRVAERGPRLLERVDRRVLGFEQVHHLVPQRREVAAGEVRLDRDRRVARPRARGSAGPRRPRGTRRAAA